MGKQTPMCCLQTKVNGETNTHVLSSDLNKREKNIHVLSSDLRNWKEKNIHVLSSGLNKWGKTSMCCLQD
jgi:hypothetical protein